MASSPLARLGPKNSGCHPRMYQPGHSSPLSASSSPTHNVQARRKSQYKSQSSSRSSLPTPKLLFSFEDSPQKQFLRQRFKHCLEQTKKRRAQIVKTSRELSSACGSSSDGFGGDEDAMEEDDKDVFNDEIYHRVMLNEVHRAQYAKRVSFEREFGSSIDPDMYEDMNALEWEYTGQVVRDPSPPLEELDDVLIREYLEELEEEERRVAQQSNTIPSSGHIDVDTEDPSDLERAFAAKHDPEPPSPSRSMFSDFQMSSPPCSPSGCGQESEPSMSPPKSIATWSCPFCSNPTSRCHIACVACATHYLLDHARLVWFDADSHPGVQGSDHIPLATQTPNESGVGVVMLCGSPKCDWCYAL